MAAFSHDLAGILFMPSLVAAKICVRLNGCAEAHETHSAFLSHKKGS
jgi:hypothetical protein